MAEQKTRIVIMGCGGSGGVPYAGNVWGLCDPTEPKNHRTRPSVYIERGETRIVIDTGPEFRIQMNRAGAKSPLSAVFYTHSHSDHINGMDDLRSFWFQSGKIPVDAYANASTIQNIKRSFYHVVDSQDPKYPNTVKLHTLQKDHVIGDLRVQSFDTYHERDQNTLVTGYRIGDFSYTTDATILTEEAFNVLKGVKVWVVGIHPYPEGGYNHPGIGEVHAWNHRIGAEQVFTTHMTSSMDYKTLCNTLPKPMQPAYDGLEFLL